MKVNREVEEDENPLDEHRTASNETIMASKIPLQVDDDTLTVAPGEGKKPISIFEDARIVKKWPFHIYFQQENLVINVKEK